jgi:hypothetical protein
MFGKDYPAKADWHGIYFRGNADSRLRASGGRGGKVRSFLTQLTKFELVSVRMVRGG